MSVRRRTERDQGYATVLVAMMATVLCALFAVVLALGQVVTARHRAGAAADLGALAAADLASSGRTAACRAAGRVAVAQGARLALCSLDGRIVDVTVEVRAGPYALAGRARAGPGPVPGGQAPTGPQEAAQNPARLGT